MRYVIRQGSVLASLALLASCNGGSEGLEVMSVPSGAAQNAGVSDSPVKIGTPYTVGSTSYTPVDIANYDEVGYASYYGAELSGRPTANGESFFPTGATAAHKILPMPSYVEVTALDTGRTILVRINDRGPFANDRLIDLSEGAAEQLGIKAQGVAGVRVRRVNPPEQERAVLREGALAAERIETPESLLRVLRDKLSKMPRPTGGSTEQKPVATDSQPKSSASVPSASDGRFIREGTAAPAKAKGSTAPQTAPIAASRPANNTGYAVQIGAFSSKSHAEALARKSGAKIIVAGKLYRVRFGPFASEAEAKKTAATAKQRGFDAKVVRD